MRLPRFAAVCAALIMAGCASAPVAPVANRLAQVEVAPVQAPGQGQPLCASLLGQALGPGERLVLASYSYGGSPYLRVRQWVTVPAGVLAQPGDRIRVAPGNCGGQAAARG